MVKECSVVTDEELEKLINTHVANGWNFDGIQFAMRESSKRPAMAFIVFTKASNSDSAGPETSATV